jgi:hypothetical protein
MAASRLDLKLHPLPADELVAFLREKCHGWERVACAPIALLNYIASQVWSPPR